MKLSSRKPVLSGLFALSVLAVATAGLVRSSVSSAASRVVEPTIDSVRILSVPTNDILFNPADQQIYASIPSSAGAPRGNSITRINPYTGVIGDSVFVGSEPSKLVLANNQLLYVHLAGAYAIRKYDLTTQTAGTRFGLRQESFFGLYTAKDFVVAPDDPELVAVARYYLGTSPPQGGVAIFRNGIQLPQTGPGHSEGAHYLAFSATGSTLYGTNDYGLKTMTVSSSGVTVQPSVVPAGAYSPIKFDAGKIFTSNGQVIDPATGTLLGTLPGTGSPAFATDVAGGRAYYLVRNTSASNTWILKAYDLATFTPIGTMTLTNIQGDATSLVRWGTNGVAFRTTAGQLVLVQTSLIPTDNPLPEPPPLPTPSPSPTPAYLPSFVRRLAIPANDAIFNAPTNSILVAVPGAAGSGLGNTITHVNPANGQIQSSVFIGSEPNKLAQSDDGTTLYAKLDGANAIRRYNVATQTAGLQFSLPPLFLQLKEIEVMPGNPDTIALSSGYDGVGLFDNGVMRPNISDGGAYSIDSFEFSSNPNVMYGYCNVSSGFELVRLTASPQGVSGTNIGGNIISGYSTQIKYSGGLLYATSGRVVDPETTAISGTYAIGGFGNAVAIEPTANRVYFLNGNVLSAFALDTFLQVGSVTLPTISGTPTALTRWGTNGLLVRSFNSSTGSSEIYLIQSALVSDAAPIPTGMQMASATASAGESSPSITIAVNRNGDLTRTTSVNYATQNGTAVAGSDYVAQSGTLNFAPGEATANITVPIINDNVYEGNENFTVVLSNPGGSNAELVSPTTANVTIFDNESRPQMSNTNTTASEPPLGITRPVDVRVQLSHPSVETITVNYATANGTATAGIDYIATSGILTFGPLETAKNIQVQIIGDNSTEPNETFFVNLAAPVNASIGVAQSIVTIRNYSIRAAFDFDGDRKTDVGIFRPAAEGGEWWINQSSTSSTLALQFGLATDRIAPADFTGDGKTDIAFFRPSSGEWFVLRSDDFSFFALPFGTSGDTPVAADYDADGKSDFAVFRPSSSTWFISQSSGAPTRIVQFGSPGDRPVSADYDGDGKADIAIFRPASSGAEWWIDRSTAGSLSMQFGAAADKAVPGDYTGDGRTDIAVWRPASGEWFVVRSEDFSFYGFPFGAEGDAVAPGDYDGDGKVDPTVFRPSSATWFIARSQAGTQIVPFGATGDRPIPNSYVP